MPCCWWWWPCHGSETREGARTAAQTSSAWPGTMNLPCWNLRQLGQPMLHLMSRPLEERGDEDCRGAEPVQLHKQRFSCAHPWRGGPASRVGDDHWRWGRSHHQGSAPRGFSQPCWGLQSSHPAAHVGPHSSLPHPCLTHSSGVEWGEATGWGWRHPLQPVLQATLQSRFLLLLLLQLKWAPPCGWKVQPHLPHPAV